LSLKNAILSFGSYVAGPREREPEMSFRAPPKNKKSVDKQVATKKANKATADARKTVKKTVTKKAAKKTATKKAPKPSK
jgi:hypothetical protein